MDNRRMLCREILITFRLCGLLINAGFINLPFLFICTCIQDKRAYLLVGM